jgi:sialate O-acetylesterase
MMKTLIYLTLLLIGSHAMAQLSMPNVFGDHMVLQADKPVKLWGQASPEAELTASYAGNSMKVLADAQGAWSLSLPPMKASADGAELTVSDGKNTLEFEDVLVGEVWFASGQSNMHWSLSKIDPNKEAITAADTPNIRFFQAKLTAEPAPQSDVEGQWTVCTPETAGGYSAVGYFFAQKLHRDLDVPVAIVQAAWGGKPVEAFTRREALLSIPEGKGMMERQDEAITNYSEAEARRKYEEALKEHEAKVAGWNAKPEAERTGRGPRKPRMAKNPGNHASKPATIWNGMIHPLAGYTMRGAIWYQGESNARNEAQASDYGALFAGMIEDWREQWGDDFRYLWVQLADYKAPVQEPGTNAPWAIVQEHQRRTLALPKTGMAVINDIGDAKNIHPINKKDVGERLARWALADDYGQAVIKSGPLYKAHEISGETVTVSFDHIGEGLKSRDGGPLQRFEIQGANGNWHWGEAAIEAETVIISHPDVKQPQAVRYAWAANPEGANLVNSEGLPASLFTTAWKNQVTIPVEGKNLVTYQAGPLVEPVGGDAFNGSNFIHPLKTPSGFIVTDSQPKDHPHHFGLWWPWKYIEFEGRKILCWELQKGDGIVQAKGNESTSNGLITQSVYIDRKAPGGPEVRLNETTEISVSEILDAPAPGYLLDLKIHHEVAGETPITINKYRYSGLGFRGTALWNKDTSTLLTSEGASRATANSRTARWIRAEGTNGEGGSAGVLIMSHPSNHAYPEKLRTWDNHYNGAIFINFNPVMSESWTFHPGKTYTRNYRLFIYDGTLSIDAAEQLWKTFAAN